MNKKLELLFENEEGRQVIVSLNDPIEPVDPEQIKISMQAILASNALTSGGGDLVAIRGARLTQHQVNLIELPDL